ncbi:unnamed protein product, partial [Brenthis ino]
MPKCSILECKNESRRDNLSNGGISYHRYPRDPIVKEKWIDATGRINWMPTKISTICSEHFSPDDFAISKKGYRYIKSTALPCYKIVTFLKEKQTDPLICVQPHLAGCISKLKRETIKNLDTVDSPSCLTPSEEKLKGRLSFCVDKIKKQGLKIKRLQSQNRRLKKKINDINLILAKFKEEYVMTKENLDYLKNVKIEPIPATAANLNEISQLRRRYYSAQVYAQTQVHSLFLSLSYSGGTTTRHDRANERDPHELKISDSNTITSAPWVKDAAIKVLIHGYTGHRDFSPNVEIRPAYLKCCDYNIICVDYNKIALEPCYVEAAHNTELVGMCTAQLIDELVQTYGFKLPNFHIIGFSLGGQAAGYIANFIKSGKIERISALDPALPLFATKGKNDKIDPGDALFVDVLHTNALKKGKLEKSGHIDFYANGGVDQPGCMPTKDQTKSGCDHARAPAYFAESIISEKGFYARKCFSWITYFMGWCDLIYTREEILFGEYTPNK